MLASNHWLSPSVSKTFSELCSSEAKPPPSHPKRGTAPSAGLVLAMSQKPGWETEPNSAGPGGRAARGHSSAPGTHQPQQNHCFLPGTADMQ